MYDFDRPEADEIRHLRLFLYLMPIFGFFPALWTLYRQAGGRQERSLSRFVIKLAIGWLLMYGLLGAAATSETVSQLPILLSASFLTSGYFVVNFWLMVRLWQRRSIELPLIGRVGRLL